MIRPDAEKFCHSPYCRALSALLKHGCGLDDMTVISLLNEVCDHDAGGTEFAKIVLRVRHAIALLGVHDQLSKE